MNYSSKALSKRQKQLDSKSTKALNKVKGILLKLFLVCFIAGGAIGISAGIGVMHGIIDSAPDISKYDVIPTGYSTVVLSDDGQEIATLVESGSNRKYATLDEIPQDMQDAFIAVEDSRFYEHNGIDPKGIARAFTVGLKDGEFSQGASTITQQLIKNNVLTTWTSETSFIEKLQRKVQEQYLAIELEKKVNNKDFILESYLNSINLGSNTLGVQAASNKYFGKNVSELTLSESAVIAGITKNPSAYNPITHPEANAERREKVLSDMLEQGYITEEEYTEAMNDDVYARIAEYSVVDTNSVNSYFVDALIEDVCEDLMTQKGYSENDAYRLIYSGGLTIHSSQNLAMQQVCDNEANNPSNYATNLKYSFALSFQVRKADGTYKSYSNQTMLSYYKAVTGNEDYSINYNSEQACYDAIAKYQMDVLEEGDTIVENSTAITITLEPQVALTVIDQKTGQVKALVGGRGTKQSNRTWNRATDTTRQPGSTFKIIACYAPALDAGGLTLASVQDDAPFTAGTKTYRNYDGSYRGLTNMRTAITHSINIVTVKTLDQIGVNLGYQYASKFGFTTLHQNDKNLGLALGGLTMGVTNLELTAAYAAIANAGVYNEPCFYTQVLDHDGNVILDSANNESHRVLKESTAWLLTDAMKDVLTGGTGTSARFSGSVAQAGKSGTTTGNRDALFAGYTPYYTCVVWGGYDDNSKQSSTSYPKKIWRNVMQQIHAGYPATDFTVPSDIVTETVCKKSGLLPISGTCDCDPRGSMYHTEFFAKSSLPTETCDRHIALNVCTLTGLLVAEKCPADCVSKRVYLICLPGTQDTPYSIDIANLNNLYCTHPHSSPEPEPDPDDEDDSEIISDDEPNIHY